MFSGANGSRSCRCTACNVDWPHFMNYARACPVCHEATELVEGATPISATAALDRIKEHETRLKHYEEFEEFYLERELAKLNAEINTWGVAGAA